MAFQRNGFQHDPGFQVEILSGGYGGAGSSSSARKREYSEAVIDVYSRADELRTRLENLPAEVVDAAEEVLQIADAPQRRKELRRRVKADNKFLRMYEALIDSYYSTLLEIDLAEQLKAAELRRKRDEEDEMAIILLLMSV